MKKLEAGLLVLLCGTVLVGCSSPSTGSSSVYYSSGYYDPWWYGMVTMTIGFTIIRVAVTTDMTIEKSSRHGGIVSTTINNSQSKTKLKIGKMAI